jgi:hypothetical protein
VNVKTIARATIPSAVIAFVAACSSPPAPGSRSASPDAATETASAALGDTVRIRLGRTVSVDNRRLLLTFRSHGSDSRCPANVTCVWEGSVAVRLGARAGSTSADVELHTGLEPRTLAIDGYVVKLVGMLPYPGTSDAEHLNAPRIALVAVTAR